MPQDYQQEKQTIRDYYTALDAANSNGANSNGADTGAIQAALEGYLADSYIWRGFHPFNELTSAADLAEKFWIPLRHAFCSMQRRMDIFMAGENNTQAEHVTGTPGVWVVSMGHLMGLFDNPWLGIPPTGKMAFLRYCEFNRVADGKITETAMFFDLPQVMIQAGVNPFPPQTGAQLIQPGPITHEGLMFEAQDPEESRKTLAAIQFMISDIKTWREESRPDNKAALLKELRRSWNEDMIWWGPAGIGATYTIERYIEQHCAPFRAGFRDRTFNGHLCCIAEGYFGGFFGWPNLTLTPTGGFMGLPASDTPGDMRVIDIYRRTGDKLTENWIFIDLLHFWHQQGLDILARMPKVHHSQ